MLFKKKLMYSGIISAATLIASIFMQLVPCRVSPNLPNPLYKWTLCSLNPDIYQASTSITEYLGYTTSLTEAYLLTLLLTFVVVMIFFHFTTKKKRKD